MTQTMKHQPNPTLDLVLEREIDVPVELVWRAWTEPELLKQWFTPAPWKTVDCVIDLRPGGLFRTVMQGPEGEEFAGDGCYLEVIENEKLVWTSALLPGYRPAILADVEPDNCAFLFTAVITLEPSNDGTKYTALVIHADERSSKKHEEMGFHSGWGTALDQLVAMIKSTSMKSRCL